MSLRVIETTGQPLLQALAALSPEDVLAPQAERDEHRDDLYRDMSTEYDARFFHAWILNSGIAFSDEFHVFCESWLRDENAHYEALRRINQLLYGDDPKRLHAEMEARTPNFEPIRHLLKDEFEVLALLALDETTSARGYLGDVELYHSFEPSVMSAWVRAAGLDEAKHGRDAMAVIEQKHASRRPELKAYYDRVLDYETGDGMKYEATFVLDHDDGGVYELDDIEASIKGLLGNLSC